jgi:hypothetical protein
LKKFVLENLKEILFNIHNVLKIMRDPDLRPDLHPEFHLEIGLIII